MVALAASIGCASTEDRPTDIAPPALILESPPRGAILGDVKTVRVRGRVTDPESGVAWVRIQGQSVALQSDGSFDSEIPVQPGLFRLDVWTSDERGNQIRDSRSVLIGAPLDTIGLVKNAVHIRAGRGSFERLSRAVTEYVRSGAIRSAVVAHNPIVERSGDCWAVAVNVNNINSDAVGVTIRPVLGGLQVTARVTKLVADLSANLNLSCEGGPVPPGKPHFRGNLDIDDAVVVAEVQLGAKDGRINVAVDSINVRINDDDPFDVDNFPDWVLDLYLSDLEEQVASALMTGASDLIEEYVRPTLNQLEAGTRDLMFLGIQMLVKVNPTEFEIDYDGARVTLAVGLEFPMFPDLLTVATPRAIDRAALMSPNDGLRIAVSDDIINHFLAALWSTDMFRTVSLRDTPLEDYLNLDRLEMRPLLAPQTTGENNQHRANLQVGDLMVSAIDKAENVVSEIAVTGEVGLSLTGAQEGRLRLQGDSQFWLTTLEANGVQTTTRPVPPLLQRAVLDEIEALLNDALDALPQLNVGGIADLETDLFGSPGYVIVSAEIRDSMAPPPPPDEDEPDPVSPEPDPEPDNAAGCALGGATGAGGVLPILVFAAWIGLARSRRRLLGP